MSIKDIHCIKLPLDNNPLKELNAYLIKGYDRSLLIDTGFNTPKNLVILLENLEQLNVEISNLELFITHLHPDHSGLAGYFYRQGCKIYSSQIDAVIMNQLADNSFDNNIAHRISLFDLDKDDVLPEDLPGAKYAFKEHIQFSIIKEKDIIKIANYEWHIMDFAGHTPGMLGLYEPNYKLLIGADHILDQISPNIGFWGFDFPALGTYLKNLQKIIDLDIDYIFSSHRNMMIDHPRRVHELLDHHQKRLLEIMNVLNATSDFTSARDIAKQITWNIRAKNWKAFPNPQKFFAVSETMAHLEHLMMLNKVERKLIDNISYYKNITIKTTKKSLS